jgi:3-dehydroquinate synthase
VCSDVSFLLTLPKRQMIAGLGEILKSAGLSGKGAVKTLVQYLDKDELYDFRKLVTLIDAAASFKAAIVSRDERDAGARLVLNFGHTFAHGIERALGYGRLLHGEAVIVGIDAALALGQKLGYHSAGLQDYSRLVGRLMCRVPKRKIDTGKVIQALQYDKKRSLSSLRFVLLERVGRPVIWERVERAIIRASLKEAIERYQSVGGSHV